MLVNAFIVARTQNGYIEVWRTLNYGSNWQALGISYPGTIQINGAMGLGYSCLDQNSFYVDGKIGFVGSNGIWEKVEVSLPAAVVTATMLVRFAYASGVSYQTVDEATSMQHTAPGWYLDDLSIEAQ